jgi:hypothetical protein
MNHMSLEIERGDWLTVETANHGSTLLPADLVRLDWRTVDNKPINIITAEDSDSTLALFRDYVEGEPVSVEIKRDGVAWRLSASGYMDCTEWALADNEDAAFAEAVDTHGLCVECGATDCAEDSSFCESCIAPNPWIVDTAQSTEGNHDIDDGRAYLVRFGDMGDVVVSARYTEAVDADNALDIACALMVENHADYFLDVEAGETEESIGHDELMERARAQADEPTKLAQRYARGKAAQ